MSLHLGAGRDATLHKNSPLFSANYLINWCFVHLTKVVHSYDLCCLDVLSSFSVYSDMSIV